MAAALSLRPTIFYNLNALPRTSGRAFFTINNGEVHSILNFSSLNFQLSILHSSPPLYHSIFSS